MKVLNWKVNLKTRDARVEDIPKLLQMMRQLAVFEGYIDQFKITERELFERGFAPDRTPEFTAILGAINDIPVGYAVTYIVPFTFDLRPTVVLKELFVESHCRDAGVGSALVTVVIERARSVNARLLRWQVLPGNEHAKKFYSNFGGCKDREWENWLMEL